MTLHEAIIIILREAGQPMSTKAIAEKLNARELYKKKDGSIIDDFQIHGRTKNYSNLFSRNGNQVSLLEWETDVNINKRGTTDQRQQASPDQTKDGKYIINLCDDVLGLKASREHRFDFLRGDGDASVRLPVDAYYPELDLVIEYREKQHTEKVNFFDKPDHITVSGIHRGKQGELYDQRRREILPKHGISLVELSYSDFPHNSNKRLIRNKSKDIEIIHQKLFKFIHNET